MQLEFKDWIISEQLIPFNTFKQWYNFHRGDWRDVESAAQKDPRIAQYLNSIASSFDSVRQMGSFANKLETMIKQHLPYHGKRDQEPISPPPDPAFQNAPTAKPGASDREFQNATTPRIMHLPQANDKDTNQQLRDFNARLTNIERRLGIVAS